MNTEDTTICQLAGLISTQEPMSASHPNNSLPIAEVIFEAIKHGKIPGVCLSESRPPTSAGEKWTPETRAQALAAIRQLVVNQDGSRHAHEIVSVRLCDLAIIADMAASSQPVAVSAWVKCSDRMPVHGTTYGENMWVLTTGPGMSRPRLLNWCAANGGHWRNEEDDRCYVAVTHWQPLPSPPAALSGDGEGVV